MVPALDDDEHYIEGAHGTLAPQKDEAYYDDRSDADDDIEKGRIRFPQNVLYGRERELETLRNIYYAISSSHADGGTVDNDAGEEKVTEDEEEEKSPSDHESTTSSDPFAGSRVVFLSGYSGIGKSALVKEFVKQIQQGKDAESDDSPVFYASGKFAEQSTAMAPFSAIGEVLEKLTNDLCGEDEDENENDVLSKVWSKVRRSELIGPGTEGERILLATFPEIAPLLDPHDEGRERISKEMARKTTVGRLGSTASHCMNAIVECTREMLSVVSEAADRPPVLFLDDLQWGDAASVAMLSFLLSSPDAGRIAFVCAYRSNEVDEGHPFAKLMDDVTKARNGNGNAPKSAERMDLFNLSLDVVAKFIADSVREEEVERVAELAEAVYTKTMGNIFFVMQALEELVRKNVLFYDVMSFEWRWVVSRVELENNFSDDVVESVKGKIRGISVEVRHLLRVMAHVPNAMDAPMLTKLTSHGEFSFEEGEVEGLLKEASDEGMLIFSTKVKSYVFAHDRIRQASLEMAAEEDQESLLRHVAKVLQNFGQSPENEWCLFCAVDLLNSLPTSSEAANLDLVKLNLEVSKIARGRGSLRKENELLHKALECMESSGMAWEEYDVTLELYNSVIVTEHAFGAFDKAHAAIHKVLENAASLDDKLQAHEYQLLCKEDETSDYSQVVTDGLKVLSLYGFDVPQKISWVYMIEEQAKLKLAMHNHGYSYLTKLPMKDDVPILSLIKQIQKSALFTSNEKLAKILAWKAIRYSVKWGMDRHLPVVMTFLAKSLVQEGKAKEAQELALIAEDLVDRIDDDVQIRAFTCFMAHGSVLTQLQPFRNSMETLLQCYRDLKLVGDIEFMFASMLGYSQCYFAAGLELGPLLESKLHLVEGFCRKLDRLGFQTMFQIARQFSLNLHKRTENPTEFRGDAFREEEALKDMNSNARRMALRDSSSARLQLAFVFWNEGVMAQMLEILGDYSFKDSSVPRLHNRLCFVGLAAFALGVRRGQGSFLKLGQKCLSHFKHLKKEGSANAKPVYLFMHAMKGPSRDAFKKAIDACAAAGMVHLEAMANERYAVFLKKKGDVALANECISSSYRLYQDWGAHAKVLHLSQEYDFLKR